MPGFGTAGPRPAFAGAFRTAGFSPA